MTGQPVNKRNLWLAVAVVAIAVTVAVVTGWRELRGPQFVAYEELPEPPLPTDPVNAELVIQDRAVRDRLNGLDEETCRKRHEARMNKLEEIKRKDESL